MNWLGFGVGAVLVWVMFALAFLMPVMEHERDYKGAFLASGAAIVGAVALLAAALGIGLLMGWTTL